MSVVINTNSAATSAAYNLGNTNVNLQRSLNRLSSGSRINWIFIPPNQNLKNSWLSSTSSSIFLSKEWSGNMLMKSNSRTTTGTNYKNFMQTPNTKWLTLLTTLMKKRKINLDSISDSYWIAKKFSKSSDKLLKTCRTCMKIHNKSLKILIDFLSLWNSLRMGNFKYSANL